MNKDRLQNILNTSVDHKLIFGIVASLQNGSEAWMGSAGDLSNDRQYFIASTTKLYITAIILQLQSEGKLNLDDKISKVLPSGILKDLHCYKGKDYSGDLTIQHLLSHTSGLPDYFEDKPGGGVILLDELRSGIDRSWTFEEAVVHSKRMMPFFKPGEKGKAHYSDTNFQLLGKIIEGVDGKPLATVLDDRIFRPLALKKTYLYTDCRDTLPADIYYKDHPLHIPKAMTSFGPDGGIVSTAEETMIFLKAFFNGQFFPQAVLKALYHWNRVMFPLEYGVGVMRFKLPWILSPFKPMPELIGHSGLSGAFAYFCPEKDVFMTGTVNQIHNPGTSYKLMVKLISEL